jgi:predicted permease
MSWIRILWARVRQVPRRRDKEADADEEFAFHLDMETARLRSMGVPEAEARRRARVSFGGVERHRETMRDGREVVVVEPMLRDVRQIIRSLLRAPTFTGATVLTLALGLGATTAVFTVVDAVLLRPLPFPEADRIHTLWTDYGDGRTLGLTEPEAIELAGNLRDAELGVWSRGPFNLGGGTEPEQVIGLTASAALFDVLGMAPLVGRLFTAAEDRPGTDAVVVLGETLWRTRFGADSAVVGTTVDIDGRLRTVVGVVGAAPDYPDPAARLWVPFALDPSMPDLSSRYLRAVVRVEPGTDVSALEARLDRLADRMAEEIPVRYGSRNNAEGFHLVPVGETVTGDVRSILLVLLGGVLVVLLIAFANVGNLMLARQEGRRHEVAIRSALGGTRGRLFASASAEGLVLSVAAGALAVLFAWAGVRVFVSLAPVGFPRLAEAGVSSTSLALAAVAVLVAGTASGLSTTAVFGRGAAGEALQRRARGGTASVAARRFRNALVVAQLALTVALLAGSGLLVRTLSALARQEPGFDPDSLVAGRFFLPTADYGTDADLQAFAGTLEDAARAVPGVGDAGLVSTLPMSGGYSILGWRLPGVVVDPDVQLPQANHLTVTPGYRATLGIPLIEGRDLTDGDTSGPRVVLVSEALAGQAWPGEGAIGRSIHLGGPDTLLHTVVGVVGDVLHHGPGQPAPPTLYFPVRRYPWDDIARGFHLVVRTEGDPGVALGGVRAALRSLDPRIPLADVRPMDDVVASATARPRFAAFLLTAFAVVGTLIAAAGVYGVLSYTVSQRKREVGIRIALGAAPERVLWTVLTEASILAITGAAGGALLFAASASLLRQLLFEVAPSDPLALAGALGLLFAVAIGASWAPASRAARVEPASCLREE